MHFSRVLPSASNFRHVGDGLQSLTLRPNRLFRSDHLGALDAHDAEQILALNIRRVLDFRGVEERTHAACVLPGVTVHSLAIEPTVIQRLQQMRDEGIEATVGDVEELMRDTYRHFVHRGTARFAEFFAHLLESDEPTVFHCTAGKDRTGFAAALLLHALGAPGDDVMRDYLLTNERLKPRQAWRDTLPAHVGAVIWRVQPDFLQAAYDAVDAEYGGLEAYLREGLGLGDAERGALRAAYLAR